MSSLATPPSTVALSQVIVIPSRGSLSRCNSYDRDRQLLRRKRQWQRRRDSSASTTGSSGSYDSGLDDNVHMIQTEEPTEISALVCNTFCNPSLEPSILIKCIDRRNLHPTSRGKSIRVPVSAGHQMTSTAAAPASTILHQGLSYWNSRYISRRV